jgi:serine/threonine protein phosphatase PrpC
VDGSSSAIPSSFSKGRRLSVDANMTRNTLVSKLGTQPDIAEHPEPVRSEDDVQDDAQEQTFPPVRCFAVLDGHGEFGHDVAAFVKDKLERWFATDMPARRRRFFEDPARTVTDAFECVDELLCESDRIDAYLSGTTCVAVFMWDDQMLVANVGDSRAILISTDEGATKAEVGFDPRKDTDPAKTLEEELASKLRVSNGQHIVQLTT